METKMYVDSLFAAYEETAALADFKEELAGNLDDKIASLIADGKTAEAAFAEAAGALGEVASLADELSLRKKQEVISEAYMNARHFMSKWRVAGYILCGLVAAFALYVAALTAVSANFNGVVGNERQTGLFGVLFVFLPPAIAFFAFLLLTQELPTRYAMTKKRAAWYALAFLVLSAGILLVPLTYFSSEAEVKSVAAIAVLLPFVVPSLALFAWLFLTEKDRRKPWARTAGRKG